MRKKSSTRDHQKVYKMKGCSRRNHKGGSADANLAYTGHRVTNLQPNPHLAYIGKGGGGGLYSSTASYTSGGVGGQGFGAGGGGGGDNGNSTPAGAGGDMVDQKYPINEFLIIDNYDSREAI